MAVDEVFPPNLALFEGVDVTPDDIGTVRVANSATDPDFDAVVALLTNGVNDLVTRSIVLQPGNLGGTGGTPETFYFGAGPGTNGIDLEGFNIESLSVRIDDFLLDSPGSDPNGNGIWTDYLLALTLIIHGSLDTPVNVPTLSAISLLAFLLLLALGGLGILRRRSVRDDWV